MDPVGVPDLKNHLWLRVFDGNAEVISPQSQMGRNSTNSLEPTGPELRVLLQGQQATGEVLPVASCPQPLKAAVNGAAGSEVAWTGGRLEASQAVTPGHLASRRSQSRS